MRNPTYEQALKRQGVEFTYHESIDIEDINLPRGLQNQARLVAPLIDELVESYAAAYKDGVEFPAVVLHRVAGSRAKYLPVDGNNRLHACLKVGKKWHDAYVLDVADQQVVDRICWTFNNAVNGLRLTREECMEHAVTFVQKYGRSTAEAAREWGLSKGMVERRLRSDRLADICRKNGVKKLPEPNVLERLTPLEKIGEDVLCAAATVIANSGTGKDGADMILEGVKNAKTHEQKIKAVDDFARSEFARQRQAETKGGRVLPPRPTPRVMFYRLIQQINKMHNTYASDPKAALRPPGAEFKAWREEVREAATILITLAGLGAVPREEAS